MVRNTDAERAFASFVEDTEPRLKRALTSRFGRDVGIEVTQDALAYAWEHWNRLQPMENPAGYLYRVGCSRARSYRRPRRLFPDFSEQRDPLFEPGLADALQRLSGRQRTAVMLVHGYGWPLSEVAELLGVSWSTVRRHADRGMEKLQRHLGAGS